MAKDKKCDMGIGIFGKDYSMFIGCNHCSVKKACLDAFLKYLDDDDDLPIRNVITGIVMVDASEFPDDIINYCNESLMDIWAYNSLEYIHNDDNALANWLRLNGYKFKDINGDYIGIVGIYPDTDGGV